MHYFGKSAAVSVEGQMVVEGVVCSVLILGLRRMCGPATMIVTFGVLHALGEARSVVPSTERKMMSVFGFG